MPSLVVLHSFLLILLTWAPIQSATPNSELPRIHLKQDQLCCFVMNSVNPIYPREARLEHTEGVVKLILVIGVDGSIADLRAVSGDRLLLDSTMKAVRQWRFSIGGFVGKPRETEVPLSFTFKIEDPPKPAYLHLTNGKVIRADEVREFTDRIEYTVGRRTHRIAADSVTDINACARVFVGSVRREGDCIPSGGPSFDIHAIPLLPAVKTSHSSPASR
ncbi:MAG TPA: energy transducer TonB [Candidatus Acidoferrales bacterium]|jgi:TonB family protein|nr:energy transducer TonB [Candidatus Acidoferrales bacterium]